MKERKQCFEKYVRSRADEERKERKLKQKEKKEEFKKLMEEIVSSERLVVFHCFRSCCSLRLPLHGRPLLLALENGIQWKPSFWLKGFSYLYQSHFGCIHFILH